MDALREKYQQEIRRTLEVSEVSMEERRKKIEPKVQNLINSIEKLDRRIKNYGYTLVVNTIPHCEGSLYIRKGFEVVSEQVSFDNLLERVAFYSTVQV